MRVGNQCRHILFQLLKQGYEVQVVAILNCPPTKLPPTTKYETEFGSVMVTHTSGVNEQANLKPFYQVFKTFNPDSVIIFQDPKFYFNLCIELSKHIRSKCPILFVTVWDTYLLGKTAHFNQWIYQSVDHLSCISRQTEWFVKEVLKESKYPQHNPTVSYVGHGSDPEIFHPLPEAEYEKTKSELFAGKNYDFVAFMNGNNQGRKKMSDVIEAWRIFNEGLSPEARAKTALVLHTSLVTPYGTDLPAVANALAGDCNIIFSTQKLNEYTLNHLYNSADVVLNVSNAGGFELSVNEAALAGKVTITNQTGGIVDQTGYTKDNQPLEWTPENFKQLSSYSPGSWCYPLYGQRTIIGSPPTPYLYDYNASIDDIVTGLQHWYLIPKPERQARGKENRHFAIKNGLTANTFATQVVADLKDLMTNFKPKPTFDLYEV